MAFPTWLIGAIINVVGNVMISLGQNLMKLGFNQRADMDLPEEKKPKITAFKWWWIGIITFFIGTLANFASFGFAAQSLLAALGAIQFVCAIIFSYLVLHEKITIYSILSTAFIIGGCMLLVVFGNHDSVTYTVDELMDLYSNIPYIVYLVVGAIVVLGAYIVYLHGKALWQQPDMVNNAWVRLMPVAYSLFSALIGTQSVIFAKSLSVLLRMTIDGENQLGNWYTWVTLICFIIAAAFWTMRLNQGLAMFPVMVISPMLQICWVILATVSGMLYFEEYKDFNPLMASMFALGMLIILVGVYLLTMHARRIVLLMLEEEGLVDKEGHLVDNPAFEDLNSTAKLHTISNQTSPLPSPGPAMRMSSGSGALMGTGGGPMEVTMRKGNLLGATMRMTQGMAATLPSGFAEARRQALRRAHAGGGAGLNETIGGASSVATGAGKGTAGGASQATEGKRNLAQRTAELFRTLSSGRLMVGGVDPSPHSAVAGPLGRPSDRDALGQTVSSNAGNSSMMSTLKQGVIQAGSDWKLFDKALAKMAMADGSLALSVFSIPSALNSSHNRARGTLQHRTSAGGLSADSYGPSDTDHAGPTSHHSILSALPQSRFYHADLEPIREQPSELGLPAGSVAAGALDSPATGSDDLQGQSDGKGRGGGPGAEEAGGKVHGSSRSVRFDHQGPAGGAGAGAGAGAAGLGGGLVAPVPSNDRATPPDLGRDQRGSKGGREVSPSRRVDQGGQGRGGRQQSRGRGRGEGAEGGGLEGAGREVPPWSAGSGYSSPRRRGSEPGGNQAGASRVGARAGSPSRGPPRGAPSQGGSGGSSGGSGADGGSGGGGGARGQPGGDIWLPLHSPRILQQQQQQQLIAAQEEALIMQQAQQQLGLAPAGVGGVDGVGGAAGALGMGGFLPNLGNRMGGMQGAMAFPGSLGFAVTPGAVAGGFGAAQRGDTWLPLTLTPPEAAAAAAAGPAAFPGAGAMGAGLEAGSGAPVPSGAFLSRPQSPDPLYRQRVASAAAAGVPLPGFGAGLGGGAGAAGGSRSSMASWLPSQAGPYPSAGLALSRQRSASLSPPPRGWGGDGSYLSLLERGPGPLLNAVGAGPGAGAGARAGAGAGALIHGGASAGGMPPRPAVSPSALVGQMRPPVRPTASSSVVVASGPFASPGAAEPGAHVSMGPGSLAMGPFAVSPPAYLPLRPAGPVAGGAGPPQGPWRSQVLGQGLAYGPGLGLGSYQAPVVAWASPEEAGQQLGAMMRARPLTPGRRNGLGLGPVAGLDVGAGVERGSVGGFVGGPGRFGGASGAGRTPRSPRRLSVSRSWEV